jgi:hypothetical protein
MQAIVESAGFELVSRDTTLAWSADVYARTQLKVGAPSV